jgi:quinol monooxygenase YgiN
LSAAESPLVQTATIRAAEGDEDGLAEALAQLVAPSWEEPGVIAYELSQSEEDPRTVLVYEVYESREAAKAHNKAEHVQRLGASEQVGRTRFDIARYRRLDPYGVNEPS